MAAVPRKPDELRLFLATVVDRLNLLRKDRGLAPIAVVAFTVEDCAFWGILIVESDSGALRDRPIEMHPMHLEEVKMNLGFRQDEFRSRGELVTSYVTNAKNLANVGSPERLAELIMSDHIRKEIAVVPPAAGGVTLPGRAVLKPTRTEVTMADRRKTLEDLKGRVLALRTSKTSFDDKKVDLVENRIIEVVSQVFGKESSQAKTVEDYKIWKGGYNVGDSWPQRQAKYEAGIEVTLQLLDDMLADVPEAASPAPAVLRSAPPGKGKVFIVHGRNHAIRNAIDLYLRDLGLQTVVLEAGAHGGRTLPEKFEETAADCSFSVFILSADDHLKDMPSGKELKRARQNVILEVGFFWGKLGRRERVAFLVEADPMMELPTDIQGMGYIPITPDLGETKVRLLKELKAAGLVN